MLRKASSGAGKPRAGGLHDAMIHTKRQYKYAIRRLKRANNRMQNDRFVQGILSGGVNIFREIKRHIGKPNNISSRIDDQVGAKNIANKFASNYNKLYNQNENGAVLEDVKDSIARAIEANSIVEADKITSDVVKNALKHMKGGKNDALYDLQSDCLKNGPESLFSHLTNLIRSFIVHGAVPHVILICTLLPLVKDNLGDTTSSDNYRAIATGSLLLKLLDIVLLQLTRDKLTCDQLQFGFQAETSTTMCSWTATTVIEHYNRQGRPVYGCAMDLSKAFDLVEWPSLFKLLLDKGVPPIFLRILLFIYCNQLCDVLWNSSYSSRFSVSNGVRQGAVSSPLLFSIYIDGLISLLRKSGLGCQIDSFYYGVLGYADDLLLLSASRSGLQAMVKICEKFAKIRKLKFSTNINPEKSKTKCVVFTKVKGMRHEIAPIMLNGNPLPWVENVKHLGNILQSDNSMKSDCLMKRAQFIGKVNSLLQEFNYVDTSVMIRILKIYVTAFYGSCLWDLYSTEVTRIYSSWNVTIRNVFNLPWTSHRYLIEYVSSTSHPKTMLCRRLVKFWESLRQCKKGSVRFLFNLVYDDRRTLTGRSVSKIATDCEVDRSKLDMRQVSKVRYFPPPPGEMWRLPFLEELLEVMNGRAEVPGLRQEEIRDMIEEICCN